MERGAQWESWGLAVLWFGVGYGRSSAKATSPKRRQAQPATRLFSLPFPFDWRKWNQIEKWNEEMKLKRAANNQLKGMNETKWSGVKWNSSQLNCGCAVMGRRPSLLPFHSINLSFYSFNQLSFLLSLTITVLISFLICLSSFHPSFHWGRMRMGAPLKVDERERVSGAK